MAVQVIITARCGEVTIHGPERTWRSSKINIWNPHDNALKATSKRAKVEGGLLSDQRCARVEQHDSLSKMARQEDDLARRKR